MLAVLAALPRLVSFLDSAGGVAVTDLEGVV